MMIPYLWRLACLALASFFIIHLALALILRCATPWAIRITGRLQPQVAARFLLALRLTPASFAALVVGALCIPSYLWLEPAYTTENVGLGCIMASFCGFSVWLASATRAARSSLRSRQLVRCGRTPLLALAGIIHPRVVISPEVLSALTPEQLAAALRHEEAHRASHDNLKRLLLVLAPGLFPGVTGFAALERAWSRVTEWSADDRAVAGSPERSLSLAAALVRVARLGDTTPAMMTSLLGDRADLATRVDRLLRGPAIIEKNTTSKTGWFAIAAVAIACTAAILQPATLSTVHRILESLV
ncbi:MAG TPA: M56 family metallopeptidase [Bryobacteraceae bacterium]|nr:M56 family metallopeptidase [Bryobacteraceae bacterium]